MNDEIDYEYSILENTMERLCSILSERTDADTFIGILDAYTNKEINDDDIFMIRGYLDGIEDSISVLRKNMCEDVNGRGTRIWADFYRRKNICNKCDWKNICIDIPRSYKLELHTGLD